MTAALTNPDTSSAPTVIYTVIPTYDVLKQHRNIYNKQKYSLVINFFVCVVYLFCFYGTKKKKKTLGY